MVNMVAAQDDFRKAIVLTEEERNLVLKEMRTFLDTLHMATVALGKEDVTAIAEPARKVGMAASGEVPVALRNKLPKEFKMLAMSTHKSFDLMALDAQELEDTQHSLTQLGSLMGNCTSCHALFKFEIEPTGK
jgi:hypothetical protein